MANTNSKNSSGTKGSNKGGNRLHNKSNKPQGVEAAVADAPIVTENVASVHRNEGEQTSAAENAASSDALDNHNEAEMIAATTETENSSIKGNVETMENTTVETTETVSANATETTVNASETVETKGEAVMENTTEIATAATAPEKTPLDRVLEGVNTSDKALIELRRSREVLRAKHTAQLAVLEELDKALATTEAEITAKEATDATAEKIREVAQQLLGSGMFSEENIHKMLVDQFNRGAGKKAVVGESEAVVTLTKTGKVRKSKNEVAPVLRRITVTLTPKEQGQIIAEVRKAGKSGIRVEDLVKIFTRFQQEEILGTLKNNIIDKRVYKEGASRGMRYYAVVDAGVDTAAE